jgi:hypothetical protein
VPAGQLAMSLQQGLQSKAAQYSDKTLACIFLLNNSHYILKVH